MTKPNFDSSVIEEYRANYEKLQAEISLTMHEIDHKILELKQIANKFNEHHE